MIDLLGVYECPNCGEILSDQVDYIEHIDTDNDEVYGAWQCSRCTCSVSPKMENGEHALQQVDHERWLWATGYCDDNDEGYDEPLDDWEDFEDW